MTGDKVGILKARARALARPLIPTASPDATVEVIEFRLAHEHYAVELPYVEEVLPLREFTPLPCTPSFIPGIVSIRGKVLAVIDIRRLFGLPDEGITDLHAVLHVRSPEGVEAGILADIVGGTRSVGRGSIQPPPATFTGIRATYLEGVTDRHLAILDVRAILNDPAILVDDRDPAHPNCTTGK